MSRFQIVQEKEGEWIGPQMAMIQGIPISVLFLDPYFEEDLPNFQTRHDDVFVTSYPKSGTTWIREMLWQIYNNGERSDVHLLQGVPPLDFNRLKSRPGVELHGSKIEVEPLPSPRLMVSHLPYHVIPKGESEASRCKYIYIARNPMDVAVSGFFFHQDLSNVIQDLFSGPLEWYLKLFLNGKGFYGFWHEHVLGWWKHKDDDNVLFLKYEDVIKDDTNTVKAIAKFVEKDLSDEVISKIAKQCSFQEMKKNPAASGVTGDPNGPSFLRKGHVGDWKNHLSAQVLAQFREKCLSKLDGTGLDFELETSVLN